MTAAPVQAMPYATRETLSVDASLRNMMGTARKNTIGTAGFILAIIAIYLHWVPIIGQIIWLLGIIFSIIGIYKTPRSLPTAGLALSYIILEWETSGFSVGNVLSFFGF